MKRLAVSAVAAAGIFSVGAAGHAAPVEEGFAPSLSVQLNNEPLFIPGDSFFSDDGLIPGDSFFPNDTFTFSPLEQGETLPIPGGTLRDFTLNYTPDPELTYGFSVTDTGPPSNFDFDFEAAITPVAGPNRVVSSYSASTTDGGDQTFTIDAQPPPAGIPDDGDGTDEVHVFTLSDDGGSSFTNAGFDLGPNFTATSFPSDTTGAFNASGSGPISTTGFDTIRVDTNFGLSGNGDVATLDGAARIEEVPVPSTLFLLGIALASVGVVTHQRNTT